MEDFTIFDTLKAGHTLEPMVCIHCGSHEVVYNNTVSDARCQDCGEWQLDDEYEVAVWNYMKTKFGWDLNNLSSEPDSEVYLGNVYATTTPYHILRYAGLHTEEFQQHMRDTINEDCYDESGWDDDVAELARKALDYEKPPFEDFNDAIDGLLSILPPTFSSEAREALEALRGNTRSKHKRNDLLVIEEIKVPWKALDKEEQLAHAIAGGWRDMPEGLYEWENLLNEQIGALKIQYSHNAPVSFSGLDYNDEMSFSAIETFYMEKGFMDKDYFTFYENYGSSYGVLTPDYHGPRDDDVLSNSDPSVSNLLAAMGYDDFDKLIHDTYLYTAQSHWNYYDDCVTAIKIMYQEFLNRCEV